MATIEETLNSINKINDEINKVINYRDFIYNEALNTNAGAIAEENKSKKNFSKSVYNWYAKKLNTMIGKNQKSYGSLVARRPKKAPDNETGSQERDPTMIEGYQLKDENGQPIIPQVWGTAVCLEDFAPGLDVLNTTLGILQGEYNDALQKGKDKNDLDLSKGVVNLKNAVIKNQEAITSGIKAKETASYVTTILIVIFAALAIYFGYKIFIK
jgi:hypothetical protein